MMTCLCIKNNVVIPPCFEKSIEIFGLVDIDDRFRGGLVTILNQSASRAVCATGIYEIEGCVYTCQYHFVLNNSELANRALCGLIVNRDSRESFNRFINELDLLNEVLGDPNMIGLPEYVQFASAMYSLARTVGWINMQDVDEIKKRINDFYNLKNISDGKPPLCINVILYGKGYFNEWAEIRNYNRTY